MTEDELLDWLQALLQEPPSPFAGVTASATVEGVIR